MVIYDQIIDLSLLFRIFYRKINKYVLIIKAISYKHKKMS